MPLILIKLIHTCTHTYIHTHDTIQSHTHMHKHTNINTQLQAHAQTHTQTHTHVYIHTCVYTHFKNYRGGAQDANYLFIHLTRMDLVPTACPELLYVETSH